jgi:hypothetical protein
MNIKAKLKMVIEKDGCGCGRESKNIIEIEKEND